jgi:signal peptide peptidase SppA
MGGGAGFDLVNGVAVIHLSGILERHLSIFGYFLGGTSMTEVEEAFKRALASPEVSSILLHIDSPGGTADGTVELAETIFAARGRKPIVALADSMAASAALWIGTAADRFLLRGPQAMTGSVGVIAMHVDRSARDTAMGLRITEVASSDKKKLLTPHQPITDAGLAEMRRRVDFVHGLFVEALARHRGVNAERVASEWGTGEIFFGQQAVALGLADGFATPDELLGEMARRNAPPQPGPIAKTMRELEAEACDKVRRPWAYGLPMPAPVALPAPRSPEDEARALVRDAERCGAIPDRDFDLAGFAQDASAALEILGAERRAGRKVVNIEDAIALARRRREGSKPDNPQDAA